MRTVRDRDRRDPERIYSEVGVVKWHWASDAWQRQTSVRRRFALPAPVLPDDEVRTRAAGDEATDESAEHGDMEDDDGRPESLLPSESTADATLDGVTSASSSSTCTPSSGSSASSMESRVNEMAVEWSSLGAGASAPSARWHVQRAGLGGFSWRSKSNNWPMKLKLGEMFDFLLRT